jgi:putative transposase
LKQTIEGVVQEGVSVQCACAVARVHRATYYRWQKPRVWVKEERTSHRKLSSKEEADVLAILHSERFVDKTPAAVFFTLLKEEKHLCSERTMYRILHKNKEVCERRHVRRRYAYTRPELLATRPNELWSWDITKMKSTIKGCMYNLYVVIDVFSRFVVGWLLADVESEELAKHLIETALRRYEVSPGQLTFHSDRGSVMTSHGVQQLLSDFGVVKTHSRPSVSNDNCYSEAQFKTMKYCPTYPERFESLKEAKAFTNDFMNAYNYEHYHSGIAMMTPYEVHGGFAEQRAAQRQQSYNQAYFAHPERFVKGASVAKLPPSEVWINKPIVAVGKEGAGEQTRSLAHDAPSVSTASQYHIAA